MRKKISILSGTLLLILQLFPTSPIFAETVQDVPVGETTISSKVEDPLKEYQDKAQNQVSTAESVVSQDVPEVSKEPEIESAEETTEVEEPEATPDTPARTPRGGGGGIMPLAGTILVEGNYGDDPNTYDIDKKFADVLRSDYSAPAQITDSFMEYLIFLNVSNKGLKSLKGIEYAVNLKTLWCAYNDISNLNLNSNEVLQELSCSENKLDALDLSKNKELTHLECDGNKLNQLDVSGNTKLEHITCSFNDDLSSLDVSGNVHLTYLHFSYTLISDINLTNNKDLTELLCFNTGISTLDLKENKKIFFLSCYNTEITSLNLEENTLLRELFCFNNKISNIDLSKNTELVNLHCGSNLLKELDLRENGKLENLICSNNKIKDLKINENNLLRSLDCSSNQLPDVTQAYGLLNLVDFNAENQQITIPVPTVSASNEAIVDILKTTAQSGLSATNIDIVPTPTSILPNAANGDIIELKGVTRDSLSDKSIEFEYDGDQLAEGANPYTTKKFSGIITFSMVSELKNELTVNQNKLKTGERLEWTWKITSLTQKKAEDIKASFSLPNYQLGDISDIEITNKPSNISQPGTINHLDGTTSLGDLNQGESIEITFKTVARGNADKWLKGIGKLDWTDNTPSSPHTNESTQDIRIYDEEQSDRPNESEDMGILSAPIYFNFGIQNIASSLKTYSLHSQNYQTNTNVVTDGFYTRIKDDRVSMDGWKLSASLSKFMDSTNREMPNGAGTTLKLNQMKIERVTDRDTPQEVVDDSPTGSDVPSTVKSTETLVAGDPAKILVNAQANQGGGTWQLRMPFDQISLDIPANAGKKGTIYKAKLTWTLNNTP